MDRYYKSLALGVLKQAVSDAETLLKTRSIKSKHKRKAMLKRIHNTSWAQLSWWVNSRGYRFWCTCADVSGSKYRKQLESILAADGVPVKE